MSVYKIADLLFDFDAEGRARELSKKYLIEPSDGAYKLLADRDTVSYYMNAYPSPEVSDWEYFVLGTLFSTYILEHDGFVLHASAVAYEGNAYLFSADPGIGKSTHAALWMKHLDGAYIINDDKPAIRYVDGDFYVYGTPWCGKSNLNENVKVRLKSICFIEQGACNRIERLTDVQTVLQLILRQTLRRAGMKKTSALFNTLDKLLRTVPFYRLSCLPNEDAAILAYNKMSV